VSQALPGSRDFVHYEGHRFVSRAGGYTGCRAFIMFLPDADFAVLVLSVTDSGANLFNTLLMRQAIDLSVFDN
jgi:hypothetical protein